MGEAAALLTSLCFSVSSTLFTFAAQRVGAVGVNRMRLLFASLFLLTAHWVTFGVLLPSAALERWMWLSLSGVIGLVLGDAFLLQAYVWIGARLTMLMMSLSPILAALVAWWWFEETLSAFQLAGMALAIAGVAWVVLERRGNSSAQGRNPHFTRGLWYGLGAAAGQALGLILARQGVAGGFPALSGTLIRMIAAALVMWSLTLMGGQAGETIRKIQAVLSTDRRAILIILGGTFFGPSLGISLSLFAVQHTQVGIASTMMALPPVILLPIGYFIFKERFGWGAIVGTVAAIAGVGLLFVA